MENHHHHPIELRAPKLIEMVGATNPSQAWAILSRHARDDIAPLRLKDLCTDNDRITSLVTVHSGSQNARDRFVTSAKNTNSPLRQMNRTLIADFSRQRMTLETLNYLLRLASAVDMKGFILTLAWGENDRFEPFSTLQSMNTSVERGDPKKFVFGDEDTRNRKKHVANHSHDDRGHSVRKKEPISPSRSVTSSYVKKTRFVNSEDDNLNQHSDDASTIHSYQPYTPSPSNLSPMNKVPLRTSPCMYMALRAPSHCNLHMLTSNGSNACDEIHSQWKKVQLISKSIRKGQMKGASGRMLTNVLIIGKGVAFAGIKFIYNALKNNEDGYIGLCSGLSDRKGGSRRNMRFLSTSDPVSIHAALSDWDPERTCIVSIIWNESDIELIQLTQVLKRWLFHGLKSMMTTEDTIVGKHLFLVTGSDELLQSSKITKPECTFLVPSFARSEAFSTTSVAGLLPLSIAFGWDIVQEILNGAHDLDTHFVETNPRHNIPVLLALIDLWNDHFLPISCQYKPSGGKIITPYTTTFESYPEFVATLESQISGCSYYGGKSRNPYSHVAPSGVVIDGGLCGAFDRVVYQGRRSPQCELITALQPNISTSSDNEKDWMKNEFSNQDRSICTFFAHADTMAFGSNGFRRDGKSVHTGGGSSYFGHGLASFSFDESNIPQTPQASIDADVAIGNRPNTVLLCSRCDPFTIGQLIALSEHRAIVTAKLWDIEHFAFSQKHCSSVKAQHEEDINEKLSLLYQRLDLLGNLEQDGDNDPVGGPNLNLATTTLLGHYATITHQQKPSQY